jgi:uncharacterized membrane protein (UPF0127 family)
MNFKGKSLFTAVLMIFLVGTGVLSCTGSVALQKAKIGIQAAGGTVVPLVVELARTEKEQEKGYMDRKVIPDGTGMVFVYKSDQQMHFWMKNTPHALSIAFLDSDGTIREIYDMAPFSLETVSSIRSVRYALEVPDGWFARAGIAVGDRLTPESLALVVAGEK